MSNESEIAQFFSSIVDGLQQAQMMRVRRVWEPRVVQALTGMVNPSLGLIRQALAAHQNLYAAERNHELLRAWLYGKLNGIVREKTAVAQAVLLEMVRQESKATAEIVTMDGLAGGADSLGLSATALAKGSALAAAVEKAFSEFKQRLAGELESAGGDGEANLVELSRRLEQHGQWWRSRLQTIAVTLTHAAANDTKLAVGEAMCQRSQAA